MPPVRRCDSAHTPPVGANPINRSTLEHVTAHGRWKTTSPSSQCCLREDCGTASDPGGCARGGGAGCGTGTGSGCTSAYHGTLQQHTTKLLREGENTCCGRVLPAVASSHTRADQTRLCSALFQLKVLTGGLQTSGLYST